MDSIIVPDRDAISRQDNLLGRGAIYGLGMVIRNICYAPNILCGKPVSVEKLGILDDKISYTTNQNNGSGARVRKVENGTICFLENTLTNIYMKNII